MPRYRLANLSIDSSVRLPAPLLDSGARWSRVVRTAGTTHHAGTTAVEARARAGDARDSWRFRIRRGAAPVPRTWYHHEIDDDGRPWRSLARDGERHVVRFRRQATFVIAPAERRVTCHRAASASTETIRQLFVGHVVPLLFAEAGALALHASAVRTPSGVLAFVGATRRGKSTIAAALAAHGCPLVADDCVIVEVEDGQCRVRPMHVGLRLWPDSLRAFAQAAQSGRFAGRNGIAASESRREAHRAPELRAFGGVAGAGCVAARAVGRVSDAIPGRGTNGRRGPGEARERHWSKVRVTADALGLAVHDAPTLLHRVYLLEAGPRGESVNVAPVSGADAVMALLVSSFQLGMDRRAQLRQSFERLSTLAAQVPVRRLHRPPGLRHLLLLAQSVLADAAR